MAKKVSIQAADFLCPITNTRRPLLEVISESDLFYRGNNSIIKSSGMKRLADKYSIKEIDITVLCAPTESNFQKHWIRTTVTDPHSKTITIATGEADRFNTGKWEGEVYKEIGQIDAQYRGAMAEKRAFDRAVIKHLQIYNTYSEVEAEFTEQKRPPVKDVKKILETEDEPDVVLEAGSEVSTLEY